MRAFTIGLLVLCGCLSRQRLMGAEMTLEEYRGAVHCMYEPVAPEWVDGCVDAIWAVDGIIDENMDCKVTADCAVIVGRDPFEVAAVAVNKRAEEAIITFLETSQPGQCTATPGLITIWSPTCWFGRCEVFPAFPSKIIKSGCVPWSHDRPTRE